MISELRQFSALTILRHTKNGEQCEIEMLQMTSIAIANTLKQASGRQEPLFVSEVNGGHGQCQLLTCEFVYLILRRKNRGEYPEKNSEMRETDWINERTSEQENKIKVANKVSRFKWTSSAWGWNRERTRIDLNFFRFFGVMHVCVYRNVTRTFNIWVVDRLTFPPSHFFLSRGCCCCCYCDSTHPPHYFAFRDAIRSLSLDLCLPLYCHLPLMCVTIHAAT